MTSFLMRPAVLATATLAVSVVAALGAAPAAQANNCQPEELVVRVVPGYGGWESPVAPDSSDPRCVVAAQLGCPDQSQPGPCLNGIYTRFQDSLTNPDCVYSPSVTNAARYVVCTVVSSVGPPFASAR